MNPHFKEKSVTLIELIVGMVILGIVILAVAQLDLFSNASVVYAQRRIRLTNEASVALEHIAINLKQAIGTQLMPAVSNSAIVGGGNVYVGLRFWRDTNGNFRRDPYPTDRVSAYRWRFPAGAPGQYLLRYCAQCQTQNCASCQGPNEGGGQAGWGVLVARDVVYFGAPPGPPSPPGNPVGTPVVVQDNFVQLEIQVCHNVNNLGTCNTPNNPQVNMQTSIQMPSYSPN